MCLGNRLEGGQKKRTPPSTKTEVRPRTRHENTRKRPKEVYTLLPGILATPWQIFFKLGRFLSWFAKIHGMWRSTRLKISLLYNNTSEAIRQGKTEFFFALFQGIFNVFTLYNIVRVRTLESHSEIWHISYLKAAFFRPARFLINRGRYQR